jgi:hypothetical protein
LGHLVARRQPIVTSGSEYRRHASRVEADNLGMRERSEKACRATKDIGNEAGLISPREERFIERAPGQGEGRRPSDRAEEGFLALAGARSSSRQHS